VYFDVPQIKEPPMSDAVFRAIADPQRRKILKLLQQGSMTAGEIAEAFEITKGSLSYHFNILKEAELIRCERRAQEQVYSLNTSVFEDVASMLLDLFQKPVLRRKRV
jgi:DNA-binding transcriptional ArsR family regulator